MTSKGSNQLSLPSLLVQFQLIVTNDVAKTLLTIVLGSSGTQRIEVLIIALLTSVGWALASTKITTAIGRAAYLADNTAYREWLQQLVFVSQSLAVFMATNLLTDFFRSSETFSAASASVETAVLATALIAAVVAIVFVVSSIRTKAK